jgi:hypothetical protein
VTIKLVGRVCARRGCRRPHWKDGLCNRCWRFAKLFGKDPRLLAYVPLGGYTDQRDAVQLPWDDWEREAGSRGIGLLDLLIEKSEAEEGKDPPASGRA